MLGEKLLYLVARFSVTERVGCRYDLPAAGLRGLGLHTGPVLAHQVPNFRARRRIGKLSGNERGGILVADLRRECQIKSALNELRLAKLHQRPDLKVILYRRLRVLGTFQ